jgi:monoterpene epsilon-lactone hydrolase
MLVYRFTLEYLEVSRVPIFGVNFRKCVTAKTAFPAALQDVVAGYFYLLDEGFSPENICVMGDSEGGCIAITLLLYLRRHGLTMPGSTMLISPFVDLVHNFLEDMELLNLDILNPEMLGMVQYQYASNRKDLRGTLLSPARGKLPDGYTFKGFPRTLKKLRERRGLCAEYLETGGSS